MIQRSGAFRRTQDTSKTHLAQNKKKKTIIFSARVHDFSELD